MMQNPSFEWICTIFRVLLLPLVALLCGSMLQAQAIPTASGGGSYIAVGGSVTAMHIDYGQRTLAGGVAYVDANIVPSLGAEAEARYLRLHTDENVTATMYLAGLRYTLHSQRLLQPYVKLLAGNGRLQFPFGYATGSYLAVAAGAGVDYRLNPRWSARLLDVEYQDWPQFTYGAMHPYGISAGLRLRVTGQEMFPYKTRHRH